MSEAIKAAGLDGSKVFASKKAAIEAAKKAIGNLGSVIASDSFVSPRSSTTYSTGVKLRFVEVAGGVTCRAER